MEWSEILAFIQKWWLEFILGGVGVALAGVAKHYFKLAKNAKIQEDEEKKKVFKEELTNEVKILIQEVKKQVADDIKQEST